MCINDIVEGKRSETQVPAEKVAEYKEKFDSEKYQKGLEFITFFEANWPCSGICDQALFYYTLPMSDGPPAETCLATLKEQVQNNLTYYGITCTIAGIIMFLTWICQYLLWKKYDD